jgi:hypothetical protein
MDSPLSACALQRVSRSALTCRTTGAKPRVACPWKAG